jgi:Fe-S-cluster containining protein
MTTEPTLDAGAFSAWLDEMAGALNGMNDADVACGTCVACCSSSQFVHIGPDEADALAHIPHELLFPAPRMPKGHVLMGYDERGRCPMLADTGCTIYEHRPRTCRTYDCRVFPATGVDPDEDKPLIAARTRRWRFDHPTQLDRIEHEAVRAAAEFERQRRDELSPDDRPVNNTQLAVMAVRVAITRRSRPV